MSSLSMIISLSLYASTILVPSIGKPWARELGRAQIAALSGALVTKAEYAIVVFSVVGRP